MTRYPLPGDAGDRHAHVGPMPENSFTLRAVSITGSKIVDRLFGSQCDQDHRPAVYDINYISLLLSLYTITGPLPLYLNKLPGVI